MNGVLIHSPLEHYAVATPEAPALSFNGEQLNYKTLNERSNQLAHALLQGRCRSEDRIGIFLHKSLDLGIAIYAILKAGCAFVPLDPYMPAERLQFILQDCSIARIISSDALQPVINNLNTSCKLQQVYGVAAELHFDQFDWQTISHHPTHNPDLPTIDQHLGYIMYTSGSTGDPKGMMHTHASSNCYAEWGRHHVNLTAGDRVASHAPLHFDLSIFDFFSTLRAGATVVLVPEPVTRFPASWTSHIESERISVVFTVPYTLITMVEQGAMDKRDLSSLRWILFGGEPYAPRQLKQLADALPAVRLTNVYGPAEAPSCTCYDVCVTSLNDNEPLPIGNMSFNSAGLIIGADENECATGEPGELCIRSSSLTKGYWNRPDLNAKVFLQKEGRGPFPQVYYRTGDQVVRKSDGLLRFLGRMDRMIKTRGHRVELDEVEAALFKIAGINEGAVYVIPDSTGSVEIVAKVTVNDTYHLTVAELLDQLRSQLPAYAIPRSIEIVQTLPHNSSGKINRKLLAKQHLKDIQENIQS